MLFGGWNFKLSSFSQKDACYLFSLYKIVIHKLIINEDNSYLCPWLPIRVFLPTINCLLCQSGAFLVYEGFDSMTWWDTPHISRVNTNINRIFPCLWCEGLTGKRFCKFFHKKDPHWRPVFCSVYFGQLIKRESIVAPVHSWQTETPVLISST